METQTQVRPEHYGASYIHRPRWISYFIQIREVVKHTEEKSRILVVGVGDAVVPQYLARTEREVVTMDIDGKLEPDIVADVRATGLGNSEFNTVLCAEVLEHLPYSEFVPALKELRRISGKWVILSLPDSRSTLLNMRVKVPFFKECRLFWKITNFKTHTFDGQHYWEIGKRGFGITKILHSIRESGFMVEKHFVDPDSPTIHFFILKK